MTEKLVTVFINDIEVKVLENSTILQACEKIGIKVPRFCYHEKLSIAGNCRMCLVEIKNAPKLQASCALPVMKDARIYTDSLAVRKAREGIMELLLINHPLDCPICDQGGECDLQDQAMYYGSDHGRFNEYKRATSDKNFGPLIKTIMTRCIHCTRCVRFASEIAGCPELGTIGRGSNMEISTFVRSNAFGNESAVQSVLDSELSGNLIDICPVGALTSLPYAFVARPWELKSIVSIDISDTYCSDIKVDIRGQGPGSILRILPATNTWISDKTRFAYDGLKRQRLITPLQKQVQSSKGDVTFAAKLWDELFGETSPLLHATKNKFSISIFLGNHIDLETLKVIHTYTKQIRPGSTEAPKVNLYFIHNDSNRYSNNRVTASFTDYIETETSRLFSGSQTNALDPEILLGNNTGFDSSSLFNAKDLDNADVCLLIGTNPRIESPVLNTSLQKVAKKGIVALFGSNSDTLPYPIKHLGMSTASVLAFIKSSADNIERVLKVSQKSNSNSSGNKVILIGSSILYRQDAQVLLTELNKFASTYGFGKLKILYQSVSELNGLYTGLNVVDSYDSATFTAINHTDLCIYYNLPNFMLNNPLIQASLLGDKLRIYVGSHGNDLTNKCDFILPTTAFTEKTGSYMTNSGKIKKTTVVTYPPGYALQDHILFKQLLLD